jgi:hypothetical protein
MAVRPPFSSARMARAVVVLDWGGRRMAYEIELTESTLHLEPGYWSFDGRPIPRKRMEVEGIVVGEREILPEEEFVVVEEQGEIEAPRKELE